MNFYEKEIYNIRKDLKILGITQTELSKMLNISMVTTSKLLTLRTKNVDLVIKILDVIQKEYEKQRNNDIRGEK
jgi:predicted transcriptional regulator